MPSDDRGSNDAEAGRTFTYEAGPDQPAAAIVEAVARMTGRDELALEQLAGVVDTDALNALLGAPDDEGGLYRSDRDRSDTGLRVTFEYEGCVVTVEPGRIFVERR